MPSLPIHVPSPNTAAALFIRTINETQSSSNTTQAKDCKAPKDSPAYTSDCGPGKLAVYGWIGFSVAIVAFWCLYCWFLILKYNKESKNRMESVAPLETVAMRTLESSEEQITLPPKYRRSVETLPVYTALGEAVDPVTIQPMNIPQGAVIRGMSVLGRMTSIETRRTSIWVGEVEKEVVAMVVDW